ncbi:MAG: Dabb family protein [Immundisolibacter sp.]|uniref:Dabb family protein n=1 Tax=Immundisolibacter sp. TaxID=1934948 RepID=UPI003EE11ED0
MIRHMVMIRLKPGMGRETKALFERFGSMVGSFDGLLSFSGGPYSSPEGINRGFNYGFSMDFRDAASRDRYLPSPEHVAIAQDIGPLLDGSFEDGVVAFDYEY